MSVESKSAVSSVESRRDITYAQVDLAEMRRVLWANRWLVLSAVLIFAIGAGVVTFALPRYYEARTTMLPVEPVPLSGGLGSLGNLGNLASLAGVTLGQGADRSIEAMALLKSRQFTMNFIRDHDLFPPMFQDQWDTTHGRWNVTGDKVPTDGDAFERFDQRIRRISQDKKTGIISLSIRWSDPKIASELANDLVARLNMAMQARAVAEAEAAISQLQSELENTDIVPLRLALSQVLESEVKNRTLAAVRTEFAMRVVDPAVPPALKEYVFPRRTVFVGGGALVGLMIGILFALWRSSKTIDN